MLIETAKSDRISGIGEYPFKVMVSFIYNFRIRALFRRLCFGDAIGLWCEFKKNRKAAALVNRADSRDKEQINETDTLFADSMPRCFARDSVGTKSRRPGGGAYLPQRS